MRCIWVQGPFQVEPLMMLLALLLALAQEHIEIEFKKRVAFRSSSLALFINQNRILLIENNWHAMHPS